MDSSVTVLNPDTTNDVEFTSSYLGIPCKGVVAFSSSGHVANVAVTAISRLQQQEYMNQKAQAEMQKSDLDRAVADVTQTSQEKLNAAQADINAAVLSADSQDAGQKWSAAINEKYPTGFNDDKSVRYVSDPVKATFSIIDVTETYGDICTTTQKQLKDACNSAISDFNKVNASKNDF